MSSLSQIKRSAGRVIVLDRKTGKPRAADKGGSHPAVKARRKRVRDKVTGVRRGGA